MDIMYGLLYRQVVLSLSQKRSVMNKNEKLGVGVLYNASLPEYLDKHIDQVDYIEIIPDMFWSDEGRGEPSRFRPMPKWMHQLNRMAERVPLVAHNIGISIGTM